LLVTPQRPQRDAEVINLEAATGHEPVWRPGEGAGSGGGLAGYEGGGPSRGFNWAPRSQGYQLGGGLRISRQMPSDDPKSGFLVTPQKVPCSDAQGISS